MHGVCLPPEALENSQKPEVARRGSMEQTAKAADVVKAGSCAVDGRWYMLISVQAQALQPGGSAHFRS